MKPTNQRQERIVEILSLLHKGGSFEEAKRLFNEEFEGVDVTEITAAEKALIQSGLDPSEIQKLCNIHAAVFKGALQLEQLVALFQVLPVDLTFVDHEDRVRFFSEGKKRVFPRTTSVIGREVVNCHPPKSMHLVQKILDDFRTGTRDSAEFWIDMRGRKIYIRYFALKNETGDYLGCLEVTQDITEIQKLDGQKRL